MVDVGIGGLITLLALHLAVVASSVRAIRRFPDLELRLLLAALLSPLIAMLVLWFGAPITAGPPFAPYFWFASGVLAYWCLSQRHVPSEPTARL
jgi:hypothetical protein